MYISQNTSNNVESTLLFISESLDNYIEHRIQTDKVLEGILKDIQGNIAENNARQDRMDKMFLKIIKAQDLMNFDIQYCGNCANYDWSKEECILPKADDGVVIDCHWKPKK